MRTPAPSPRPGIRRAGPVAAARLGAFHPAPAARSSLATAALVGLVASGLTACLAGSPGPPATAPARALTVATYNLNYGLAGDPETLAAARATRADVLLLQETSPAWVRALRDAFAASHPHHCAAASARPAGGMLILSRFPLRDCRVSPSALGWFPAQAAVVEAPGGALRVINLHLKPVVQDGSLLLGLFVTHAQRAREMRAHLGRLLEPDPPVILGGDFNEAARGGLGVLEVRGFVSVLPRFFPSASTWGWPLGAMPLEKRLDHLVIREDGPLRCVDARVLGAGRSDHRPVVGRFVR